MFAVQKRVNFLRNIKRIKILEKHEIMPSRVKIELYSKQKTNVHLSYTEVAGILEELKTSRIKNVTFVGCDHYNPIILRNILKLSRHMRFYVSLEIGSRAILKNFKSLGYVNRIVLMITNKKQINKELFNSVKKKEKSLDICMVLNRHITNSLEELYLMMDKLNYDEWFFVRPRPAKNPIPRKKMSATIHHIMRLNKKYFKNVFILSPVPFCIDDADCVSKVCIGGFNESGYTDITIDSRGRIKPDLSSNVYLGTIKNRSISSCWNSDHMKRVRQFKNVAKMCLYCNYLFVCGGGRIDKSTQFNYFPTDPLVRN
jgi:radical SAM protein with 4Fe4S-binding SPASM domain